MPRYLRIPSLFITLSVSTIVLLVALGTWQHPAISQATSEPTSEPKTEIIKEKTAPIVIDGREIFEIGDLGEKTAKERASKINTQLEKAVKSQTTPQLTIKKDRQPPQILLNNQPLLTVTQADVRGEKNQQDQVKSWLEQLDTALDKAQSQRSAEYLKRASFIAIAVLLGGLFLSWLLGVLKAHFVERLIHILNNTAARFAGNDLIRGLTVSIYLLLAVARIGILLASSLYIASLFPYTQQWSYQITSILISSFLSPFVSLGNRGYALIDFLILGGLIFALLVVAASVTNILRTRVLSAAGINRGAQEAIAILTKYSLIVIGGLVLLQVWGLELSSLTIVASALSIGVGIGLQDIAKNFASGLILVFERPIQAGDFIEVGSLNGTVERIGARSTEIRTLDHVSIIVPNSRFLESEVINWSHSNPISRLHIPVGVSYNANPENVRDVLLEAVESHSSVLTSPPPSVLFKQFGDSSLDFEVLVWTSEPHHQFVITSDLYFNIFKLLAEKCIEIPFPQRDLHIRSGSLGLSPEIEAALVRLSNYNFRQYSLSQDSSTSRNGEIGN